MFSRSSVSAVVALGLVLAGVASAQPRSPAPASPARRPGAHVVHPDGIARAQFTDPTCVQHRGCDAPTAVPACPAGTVSQPVATVWARRFALLGHTVTVEGTLRPQAPCTEMACVDRCCNSCSGGIHLASPSDREDLQVGDERTPAFACNGDDSGLCCGTEIPAGRTVVTGTLALIPGSGGSYRIEHPTLCQLPSR